MNVGYDNILTSTCTLLVVKLREIITVAAADTQQLELSAMQVKLHGLLTVSGCKYLAWVAHGENSTPSTYNYKKTTTCIFIRNNFAYTDDSLATR